MGPPEPALVWRVQILLIVRVLVMVPVVRGPPQGTPLSRAGPQNRKRELCRPAGFEGFVGEIAMVEARDREHPYQEERNGKTSWRTRVVPLGTGFGDFPTLLQTLGEMDYDGPVSFHSEYSGEPPERVVELAHDDVNYIDGLRG